MATLVLIALLVWLFPIDLVSDEGAVEVPKQEQPLAELRHQLAERFAPVLALDSSERFRPLDLPRYLAVTDLRTRTDRVLATAAYLPTLATLPVDRGACALPRCQWFLDVEGLDPPSAKERDYERLIKRRFGSPPATVYYHVTRYPQTDDYAVQFWLFYLFNYRLNLHEGDWEMVTVRVHDDRVTEAFYSSHNGGKRARPLIDRATGRPVVFVAEGSHANYFRDGSHAVGLRCLRFLRRRNICVETRARTDRTDGKRTLAPGTGYRLAELAGRPFVGDYGSGNYVAGFRQADTVSDPRGRASWRHPLERFRLAKRAKVRAVD